MDTGSVFNAIAGQADNLLTDAIKVSCQYDRASASLFQRRLSIGYARAARIMDQLETLGVLSPSDGSAKPREVLIKSFKEFEQKFGKIEEVKQQEVEIPVTKYTPKPCDFLPKEVKSLTKSTDLPYLKTDLTKIGNLIITGNVLSKKYEYIKTYILYVLSKFDLNDVRLIIDDNTGTLKDFGKIPHLLNSKNSDSLSILRWLNREMDRRIEISSEKEGKKFPVIIYIGTIFSAYSIEIEDAIKRLSSMGAYADIHLILLGDRLGDFPKMIKDNVPARLEFDKFGENTAVFSFKEKHKINLVKINNHEFVDYISKLI
jgi:DNA segregation ATPase FtsK/SpoIIIE-like protein